MTKSNADIKEIVLDLYEAFWKKWDKNAKRFPDSENNILYEDIILRSAISAICVGYISRYTDEYSIDLKHSLIEQIDNWIDQEVQDRNKNL